MVSTHILRYRRVKITHNHNYLKAPGMDTIFSVLLLLICTLYYDSYMYLMCTKLCPSGKVLFKAKQIFSHISCHDNTVFVSVRLLSRLVDIPFRVLHLLTTRPLKQ